MVWRFETVLFEVSTANHYLNVALASQNPEPNHTSYPFSAFSLVVGS